jgi:hypothetical protein
MISAKFNAKQFTDTVKNIANYSEGFIQQARVQKKVLSEKMADIGIDAFYDYLDGLARMHPGILHHVYEWGEVGDPFGRLFELSKSISGNGVTISADFLQSTSVSQKSNEPFYDKAMVMELGETIIVSEVNAQALFFEVEGQEIFVKGPITIENPGGEGVRGSFVEAFNEFYQVYFSQIYLKSIRFYKTIEEIRPYKTGIRAASKSKNSRTLGTNAANQWINSIGRDDING